MRTWIRTAATTDGRSLLVFCACFFVPFASVAERAWCAEPEERQPSPLYDQKPQHLWNRLHSALLVRTGPDDKEYGQDRLEPLLWNQSRYLLSGPSGDRARAVLEEFVRERGEKLIDDPVKRAILQRDLWLVANWLSETGLAKPPLERALGQAIRRLALSPREIARLPDNYAAAAATLPNRFDPRQPDRAYLPRDLFQGDGPWVCVGRADGLTAPHHFNTPFNNSVFLVFLKLPGGRDKTLDFLKQLGKLERLLVPNSDEKTASVAPFLPPPEFPKWPKGTEVALVRRALLIDSNGKVAASPLTESVQLRVVAAEPALTKEVLEKAASRRPDAEWQSAFEFQLRRADLFAGKEGGLRDVSGERDFKTGFSAHAWDEFDRKSKEGNFPERSQPFATSRASCAVCHTFPGAYSFNSVPGLAFGGTVRPVGDGLQRPPGPVTPATVEKEAIKWKEGRPAWAALVKWLGS
jgi:hypothetical protein